MLLLSVGRGTGSFPPLLAAGSVAAGALASGQQALNGRVQSAVGEPMVATLVNFLVGGSALAVVTVVALAGQLTAGLILDVVWRPETGVVRPVTFLAIALAFLGVALSRDPL